ncbi:hypothetical protein F4679DRAFT_594734 [Xylaria curta]|nr:hypothetical protein F4679DRAFT_594734 [Xylaria curta]
MDIETWLWRQWFRPYTTEIELCRSFVNIFALDYKNSNMKGSDIPSDDLISLHCDICEQSERFKEAICTSKGPNLVPSMSGPLRGLPWPRLWNEKSESCGYTFIQPLFRALFMVLVYPKEQMPFPKHPKWMVQAQVQLVLTGITDGLSAPICFDEIREYSTGNSYTSGSQAITTTLEIATKFILRLEQREVAAFGIQPNVCKYREEAMRLGWIKERDGRLDELSPRSSEWVDRTLFPKWLGKGASQTMEWALELRLIRRWQGLEQYTKDWWWNYQDLPESPNTHDA